MTRWRVYLGGQSERCVEADVLDCRSGALIFIVKRPMPIPNSFPLRYFEDVLINQVVMAFARDAWVHVEEAPK